MAMTLRRLPTHDAMTKKTRDQAGAINARVDKYVHRRNQHEEHRQRLRTTPVADLDPSHVFRVDEPQANAFELLKEEHEIRLAVAAWWGDYLREMGDAAGKAAADLQAKERDIRDRLVQAGYVLAHERYDSRRPGTIMPVVIATHPEVVGLRGLAMELRNHASENAGQRENAEAIAAVEAQMARLRDRAIAV